MGGEKNPYTGNFVNPEDSYQEPGTMSAEEAYGWGEAPKSEYSQDAEKARDDARKDLIKHTLDPIRNPWRTWVLKRRLAEAQQYYQDCRFQDKEDADRKAGRKTASEVAREVEQWREEEQERQQAAWAAAKAANKQRRRNRRGRGQTNEPEPDNER